MAGKFTVIPQSTFKQMQMDAGVLLKKFDPSSPVAPPDEDIICATTGGIVAACESTFTDLGEDVDNCPNNTKELKHFDGWDCRFEFTALGTTPALLKLELGVADIDTSDDTKVVPRMQLKQTDFSTIWWVGDRADGGFVAIELTNALSTSGLSLQTTKNGKGQVSCTLTGHTSLVAQDKAPMTFYSAEPEEST